MPSKSTKANCRKTLLFVLPGTLMLLVGFGILLKCSIGGRLNASQALLIPLGFATASIGAMLLTRTLLATFFLLIYSLTALIIGIRQQGFTNPALLPFILLVFLCLPLAKYAKR